MDRSVNPGDDFYRFANGEWIKHTEIPADRDRIGVFSALDDISPSAPPGSLRKQPSPTPRRHQRPQDRRPLQLLHG